MKVVIPIYQEMISSVFDVAKQFVVLTVNDGEIKQEVFTLASADPYDKVKQLLTMHLDVLICGAISWPLERMLTSSGVRVIPNTCGLLENVVHAFLTDHLTDTSFLMPGCKGKRRRYRCRFGNMKRVKH